MLRVDVIAETKVSSTAMYEATDGVWLPDEHNGEAAAVFAGRACYASWHKPNPATADTEGYLANIIKQQHFNVLRHAVVTVYIQGVSRSLTHELIRHHVGIDFSQLSQRYVEPALDGYVVPPAMRGDEFAEGELYESWREAVARYSRHAERLETQGKTRKQAREAARAFLPNCAETKIVVTANLQAWRNFLQARGTGHADAEIHELALELAWILNQGFPAAFQDMHLHTDIQTGASRLWFGEETDE